MVDWTRRAHDEPCRFFHNNDRIDTVRFVDAEANAPALPFWSVVYCAENDPVKYPDPRIGTLRRTPFGFTGATAPAGLFNNHYCGTPAQFADGATFDALTPPRPVGALAGLYVVVRLSACAAARVRVGYRQWSLFTTFR